MPIFNYKARNPKGELQSGVVDAANAQAAADVLRTNNLVVVSLLEEGKEFSLTNRIKMFERVHPRDIVIFSRQLATMISATLPIVQALKILSQQQQNPLFRSVLAGVTSDVEGGARLSVALKQYPKVFSSFFISVIATGETSGKLEESLNYLADQMEKDYELNSRIKSALYYPSFILLGLVVVAIIMVAYVIPQLESVLGGMEDLPWTTSLLLGVSDFFRNFWWVLVIVICLLALWLRSYIRTDRGKRRFDRYKLRLPIFGKLFHWVYIVRFTRNMSTLLSGGVKILDALETTSDVIGNTIYEDIIKKAAKRVEAGDSMSSVLVKEPEIPLMVSQVISVGEQTGKLPFTLDKIADFYTAELDNSVRGLSSLLEPVIMVILGIGVGILMAAVIMPIYNISSQF
jgi:type IV pilus assembly protein PilC